MSLEEMTREELAEELQGLLGRLRAQEQASEQSIHELRVYQVELELQNRVLRETQAALEESRSRLQDLYDFAPVAYQTLDEHGCVLEANLTGATMVGRDRSRILGKAFLSLVSVRDEAGFWEHLRRCAETRAPVVTELAFSAPGRPLRHVQVVSVPVLDASGRAHSFRTSFTDVTERVEAVAERERIRLDEARRRAGLEALDRASCALNDALARPRSREAVLQIIVDHAAGLAGAEFAALGVVGAPGMPFSPWVFSGLSPARAARLGAPPRVVGLLGAVVATGRTMRLRDLREHPAFRGFPPDHPQMTSFLGVPIVIGARTIGHLYLTNKRQATEFSELDQEFVEMLATRAARVLEIMRLGELVQAAVRARDDILAIVSHDLRGPLSVIQLSSRLLATAPATGERRASARTVDMVTRAADRMSRLLEDLLEASTIETGTFTLTPERLDPRALVGDVIKSLEPIAGQRTIRLRAELADDLPPLAADPHRLIQLLSNLIGNSIKFTPVGASVRVRAWATGGFVHFAVSDEGRGIPESELPHLFDRHWTGKKDRNARGAGVGLGLGLFIAKGIVDAHGGLIRVESTAGKGTTVFFTMPVWRERVATGPTGATASELAPPPMADPALRGLRTLIVDDDANAVSALVALLRDEGMVPIGATSGEQALASLEWARPDLVALDVEMPGMDGITLLERLRARLHGLPAVIMTGQAATHAYLQATLASPGVAYVSKPIDVHALLDAFGRLRATRLDPITDADADADAPRDE